MVTKNHMGDHFPEIAAVTTTLLVIAYNNINHLLNILADSNLLLQITFPGVFEVMFLAVVSAGTARLVQYGMDAHKHRIIKFFKLNKNEKEQNKKP